MPLLRSAGSLDEALSHPSCIREELTVNLVNNFDNSSEDEFVETHTDLAVNLIELYIVDDSQKSDWCLDSGASRHVIGCKSLLRDLEGGSRSKVSTAGDDFLNVADKGKMDLPTASGEIQFDNVLYVRGIAKNLLSVGSITDGKGKPKVLFDSHHACILHDLPSPESHQIISIGKRDKRNGLYKFCPPNVSINSVETLSKEDLTSLWHSRFCHTNLKVLIFMATQDMVEELPVLGSRMAFCEACCVGKQSRNPILTKVSASTYKRIQLFEWHRHQSHKSST